MGVLQDMQAFANVFIYGMMALTVSFYGAALYSTYTSTQWYDQVDCSDPHLGHNPDPDLDDNPDWVRLR